MFEKVRIGDLGEIYTGNTPSKKNKEFYDTEDIMFIKPDILSFDIRFIDKSNEYISEKAKEKARVIPKGSLLVSCIGNIGKLGINNEEVAFNQQINAIIHNNKICSSKYLAYLLKYNQKKLEAIANAPVVPIINKSQFSDFEVVIHKELFEQKQLVKILDKAQQLIDKRKEQIEDLDKLVKSKFIEMFGDPIRNNMNWEIKKVGDIAFVTKLAGFEYTQYINYQDEGEVVVVKGLNVKEKKLKLDNVSYIDKETSDLLPRSQLKKNDLVMTYVGINIGDVALVDGKNRYHLAPNVAKISLLKESNINPVFMVNLLYMSRILFSSGATSTAKQALNMGRIREIDIMMPPVELQNQFADFVKQVDKLKFEMEKSLKELEDNFNSLMQRAFNGELF